MHHLDGSIFSLISLAFSLFLLMDPIGNIPMYLIILKGLPAKRQKIIIIRELIIALVIIVIFMFLGEFILKILSISQPTLLLSGGIILFLIALKMIFPSNVEDDYKKEKKEPFIVPLAIPFVAGPSVLAAVMIYSRHTASDWVLLFAIIIAWIASTLVLLCSSWIERFLGEKGLTALERLMGLILTLIAVQMFLEGMSLFMQSPHQSIKF